MPPHAIGSGMIAFGLVSIPIKLYAATASGSWTRYEVYSVRMP